MALTTEVLSRAQFGFTVGFHILFPALNIGLATFLCVMEGIYLKTGKSVYLKICKFWTKIFALTFGMGVVSGIVLSYELGTNFAGFTKAVGEVLGPLFGYEVLSAFFLEAGFLGIMLFGWQRVSRKVHYAATLFVAIGTLISAFWILAANSWMQTPAGYLVSENKFIVDQWSQVIFNPSTVYRFIHMVFASYLSALFAVAGVSAWYLLKKQHLDIAKPCFSIVMLGALIFAPLQILVGDVVGLIIHEYQPIKTAAMEGNWQTMRGAPLVLLGWPDTKQEKNLYAISIPKVASWINTHDAEGELQGLTSVPAAERPNVPVVFFTFRAMVGIGFLFLFIAGYAMWLRWRGKLYNSRNFLRLCVLAIPLGFVATIAGWLTAEIGRQPWIVHNLLRTRDAVSEVPMQQVLLSFVFLILVYGIIFVFYLYYVLKLIRKGPEAIENPPIVGYMTHSQEEPIR